METAIHTLPVILAEAQRSAGIYRRASRPSMDPGAAPLTRLVQDDGELCLERRGESGSIVENHPCP